MHAQPRLTRRAMLSGSVASLALPWVLQGARAAPAPGISDAAWKKLAGKITGGVLWPNDPRFVALTRPENLRYYNPPATPDASPDPDAPFAVVRPHDAKEVADAILWAQDVGCPMVARSGGHSYAGCSTIRGLVIHLGNMRQVKYNPNSSLLEVGGGALNGDIFAALRPSKRAIVHGRCPAVGISAFLMGGGIGLAMREHGVGCDLVDSVELVLADGKKVRASASNEYKELFWAVRGGGGGNLGVATRWRLHTVPVDKFIAFTANWWSSGKKPEIFKRLVRALEAAPEQMGAQMSVFVTALNSPLPNRISLTGQFRGPLAKFQTILGSALAGAEQKAVLELPYWQAQEFFEIEAEPNRYQETSLFADELSDPLIEEAFSLSRTLPGTAATARLTFFLTGGRVNKIKPDATAFVHRSSQWLINPIVEQWPADYAKVDDDLKWQRKVLNRFAEILGGSSCYQNFSDPELDNHAEAYWGANLSLLSKVKAAFDPRSVFTPPRNQGIPQPA
jgi:FAD binding domain/Berberine and berberine like